MSESTWDDPRITAFVLDELADEEKTAFQADCEANPELAAAVEEARGVTDQLKELYAGEQTPPLDVQRRNEIVGGKPATTLPPSETSWRVPAIVLATAAVLLLLVGIAPLLRERDRTVVMDQPIGNTTAEPKDASAMKLEGLEKDLTDLESAATQSAAEPMAESMTAADNLADDSTSPDVALKMVAPSEPALPAKGAPRADSLAMESPGRGRGKPGPAESESVVNESPKPQPDAFNLSLQQPAQQAGQEVEGQAAQLPAEVRRQTFQYKDDMKRQLTESDQGRSSQRARRGAALDPSQPSVVPAPDQPMPADRAVRRSKRSVGQETLNQKAMEEKSAPAETASPTPAAAPEPAPEADASADAPAPAAPALAASPEMKKEIAKSKNIAKPPAPDAAPFGGRVAIGRDAQPEMPQILEARLNKDPRISDPFGVAIPEGRGAGISGDKYDPIVENDFIHTKDETLSTFSIDVDTASYSKTRYYLNESNQLPRPDAVRIEELINYFSYDYKPPKPDAEHPFATHVEVTQCPWNTEHQLARIGLKGKTMSSDERPPCNLVFLIDTSGSMRPDNKLPLVIEGLKMLVEELNEQDKVAITVYAGSAGLVLDSTPASDFETIDEALTRLKSGGSTNGGAGIALAYQTARSNFIEDGVNRVILCTDGDFNVGVTGTGSLVRMVEEQSKGGIFLSVLGFGMGNHNDAMLEQISGRGNGNYAFIDTRAEAHKVFVDQTSGTLVTIAKDVKIQVDFNLLQVGQYRLIGYENRVMPNHHFNDDSKDAGEIGAGHAVTALYELVPPGKETDDRPSKVQKSDFVQEVKPSEEAKSNVLLKVRINYKQPDADEREPQQIIPIENNVVEFEKASDDVRFAAAVASFGMQLRNSKYAGDWTMKDVEKVANSAKGEDDYALRDEFVQLVHKAAELMGQN